MDRNKVIRPLQAKLDEVKADGLDVILCSTEIIEKVIAILKEQESRWMSEGHKKDRFCERCGHDEPYKNADEETKIFNYCPHCGARMTN